jgi:hypothetical protein
MREVNNRGGKGRGESGKGRGASVEGRSLGPSAVELALAWLNPCAIPLYLYSVGFAVIQWGTLGFLGGGGGLSFRVTYIHLDSVEFG